MSLDRYLPSGGLFDTSYRPALFPFSLKSPYGPPMAFKLGERAYVPTAAMCLSKSNQVKNQIQINSKTKFNSPLPVAEGRVAEGVAEGVCGAGAVAEGVWQGRGGVEGLCYL